MCECASSCVDNRGQLARARSPFLPRECWVSNSNNRGWQVSFHSEPSKSIPFPQYFHMFHFCIENVQNPWLSFGFSIKLRRILDISSRSYRMRRGEFWHFFNSWGGSPVSPVLREEGGLVTCTVRLPLFKEKHKPDENCHLPRPGWKRASLGVNRQHVQNQVIKSQR